MNARFTQLKKYGQLQVRFSVLSSWWYVSRKASSL